MRSTTRNAAGALAVALALGAGSPVAAAGPSGTKPGHVQVLKGDQAVKGLEASQSLRQVLRDIARTDARLVRTVRASRTAQIGDHAASVIANVTADRDALAGLVLAVQAADSAPDLRAVRKDLKGVRPQSYTRVINNLRSAVRLADAIAEARTAVEGDPEAPVAELATAQAAVEAAVSKALLVTASSDKDELRAVQSDLQAAHDALAVVRGYLDAAEQEPVVEEPVEELVAPTP